MTTSHPTEYVDPFPGRKGSDRIVEPCGKCAGTGVYQAPSGLTFYTATVGAVTAGCFDCRGTGTRSFLVSSARSTARRAAKRRAEMIAEHEANVSALAAFQAEYGELIDALAAVAPKDRFLSDLYDRYLGYGPLTADEVAAAREGLDAVAAREAAKVPVVEGRYEMTGTVLSQKCQESDYGLTLKMLVAVDHGGKVWGTVPRDLDVATGDRVAFTATVERSRDDAAFGFFKRPTRARVLLD